MNTENLSTLKIHKLTQEQYDREFAAGRIDENALYLTPADDVDLSGYATIDYVDSAIGEISTSDASGQIEEHNTDPDAHPVILEKINAIKQANWNQNDSSEKDFINNRPFYTTDPEETVIANGTIPADGMMQTHASIDSLTIGETYTAIFDGVTYSNLICENYEGLPTVMNEHFMFAIHSGNSMAYATDRSTSHTLEVMAMLSSVVPIERKYIAEHIDMIAGEKVEGRTYTVDGSQVIAGVGAEVFNDYDKNIATGKYSHAEGSTTVASGHYSHAEGVLVVASGSSSHAEGSETTASGFVSHAEGQHSEATNDSAHAEGFASKASGKYSHAEGDNSIASGLGAHAEGYSTQAIGSYSHAEGFSTIASSTKQHVQGRYNVEDANDKYAHIVGNGYSNDERSNAHTLDWQGNGWFAKDVYVGGTSQEDASKLATEYYVDNAISEINIPVDSVNGKTGAVVLSASDVGTYTTTDIDTKLNGKSDVGHNHDEDYDEYGAAADALNSAKAYTDTKTTGLASTSTVDTKINTHSTSTDAHNDIRVLITELTNKLNNFLDVDDTTSDQLSEVLTLIENNKGTLASLTISKVNVSDIINNLTTNSADKVLSAAQGVAIKGLIDALQAELDSHTHAIADVTNLQTALDAKVPSSRTINGKALSSNVTLSASDVQAIPSAGGDVTGWLDFGSGATRGLVWTLDDGTKYRLRPYGSQLQLVRIPAGETDAKATININKDGQVTFGEKALPIGSGGTGATTAEAARTNLGITPANIGASESGHTHNYAGSSSAGGAATSANKLNTDNGSATQPVYFSNGVPVATTYTLGASVPSGAKFTDTVYTHPTSSGNKHIPSGGSSGQILRWSANGTAVWGEDNNTTYSAATQSAQGLMSAADKKKLDGIATGANAYSLPTASSSTLGGVKTTSTVTSTSGLTACPIISGVPYYKNTTYTLSSFSITATATELNYCDGVTSNIQTQLNGKAANTAAGLKGLFAAGATILSSHQYGSTLPSSGTAGQLFFLLAE